MDKELKQKLSILIISLLAIVKFIILPEIENQNSKINEINEINKINAKYQDLLIRKDELVSFSKEAQKVELSIRQELSSFSNQAEFLLHTQKILEQSVTRNELQIKRFVWFNGDDDPIVDNLYKKKVRLVLSGNVKSFLKLHKWIDENQPKFKMDSLSVDLNGKSNVSLGWFTGTIIISAYYYKDAA